MDSDWITKFVVPSQTKIVMLIMDGLGGLPRQPGGKTELELARTPNMDSLAGRSSLGLSIPVGPGITPGSGPGHLALFGYDPILHEIGRGAMEALGVDFDLQPKDLAARGNFCTVDSNGVIIDRRAGRIPTEVCRELAHRLCAISIDGTDIFIEPVKEHRFAFIMRGQGLYDALTESDPQIIGVPPQKIRALDKNSEKAADLVNQFITCAQKILIDQHLANMILLRGFAKLPTLTGFQEKYGIKAAAIALNGMYRGVARLVGMQVLEVMGQTLKDEIITLVDNWNYFDFFYVHVKKTDTYGELGDFDGKVKAIEEVDALLPEILALHPDVVIIGGDHSSPAVMKSHSWHPVPLMIYSPLARTDGISEFGERACLRGSLGIIPAAQIMPLALANALRLTKYGA